MASSRFNPKQHRVSNTRGYTQAALDYRTSADINSGEVFTVLLAPPEVGGEESLLASRRFSAFFDFQSARNKIQCIGCFPLWCRFTFEVERQKATPYLTSWFTPARAECWNLRWLANGPGPPYRGLFLPSASTSETPSVR